jgi:hypothetical protein
MIATASYAPNHPRVVIGGNRCDARQVSPRFDELLQFVWDPNEKPRRATDMHVNASRLAVQACSAVTCIPSALFLKAVQHLTRKLRR